MSDATRRTPPVERRALASIVVSLVVLAAAFVLVTPGVDAQPTVVDLELVLVDQTLRFGPDGDIELMYELDGDLTGAGLTPPTTVPTPTTTPAPTSTDVGGEVPIGPPPTAPDVVLPELVLEITNHGAIDDSSDLRLAIGPDPATSLLPDVIDGVAVAEVRTLVDVSDDGATILTIVVGTDQGAETSVADRLRFDDPGLYPVVVDLLVDGELAASHGTVVERLADPPRRVPPLDLGSIGAVADPGPAATDAELAAAVDEFEELVATAGDLDAPMTLAIPPLVVSAATAEPSDADRIADLLVDDELLVLPAVPFDVSAAAAADRVDAFLAQLAAGEEALIDALPSVPVRRDVWLAAEPISAEGAQVLRDAGVRHVVATPDVTTALLGEPPERTDRFVEFPLPGGGTMPVIPIDVELAERLTGPADEELDGLTPTEWLVGVNAEVLLERRSTGLRLEPSRVLAHDDLGGFDPTLLQLLATAELPTLRFVPVSGLTGVTDAVPATLELPPIAGPDLGPRVDQLSAAELELASAASMLDDDDPRPAEWTRRLAELVATGYPQEVVDATVDDLRAEADRLRGAIVPPEPFTFTLTGSSGDIELRIGNSLDEPVKVLLRLSSPRLSFPSGDEVVELDPGLTVVRIPVRARSNGTSSVEVEILTPLGEPLTEPVDLRSRVTALTGLGPVLTGGLVLVLLSWWFSHWRRRRRQELGDEETGDDEIGDHGIGDGRTGAIDGGNDVSVPGPTAGAGNLSDP